MARPTPKSSSAPGRPLRGQAREIVYKVSEHLKGMRLQYGLEFNLSVETSKATGVGKTLVKQIIKEGNTTIEVCGQLNFSTPTGKKQERRKKLEMDDFTKASIRRKIHEMYVQTKIFPTRATICQALKDSDILNCGKTYLNDILIDLGFKWEKCYSNRKIPDTDENDINSPSKR